MFVQTKLPFFHLKFSGQGFPPGYWPFLVFPLPIRVNSSVGCFTCRWCTENSRQKRNHINKPVAVNTVDTKTAQKGWFWPKLQQWGLLFPLICRIGLSFLSLTSLTLVDQLLLYSFSSLTSSSLYLSVTWCTFIFKSIIGFTMSDNFSLSLHWPSVTVYTLRALWTVPVLTVSLD